MSLLVWLGLDELTLSLANARFWTESDELKLMRFKSNFGKGDGQEECKWRAF